MGQKETLQKEIDRLERYAKFYLNILLAILTGLTGIAYATLSKGIINIITIFFISGGVIAIFLVILKINRIDKKENELLNQLRKED